MRIAEVKIGTEYGLVSRHRNKPRRVRALAMKAKEHQRYDSLLGTYKVVSLRGFEVEVLDEPRGSSSYRIEGAAKGATLLVEARELAAPWAKLAPRIREEAEREEFEQEQRAALAARLKALGVRGIGSDDYYSMTIRLGGRKRAGGFHAQSELRLEGAGLEKLLSLAEAGKAAQS